MKMKNVGEECDSKAQLVIEICAVATVFTGCSHSKSNTRFVDWYQILKVNEDAGSDVIRRRYRQLALQLHPDKNWHPKAEVAFKLISQAYDCLSDKARRKAFNDRRRRSLCSECYLKFVQKNCDYAPQITKRCRGPHAFGEIQSRLREECEVIEKCLRANYRKAGNESPVFDPSYLQNDYRTENYQRCFGGMWRRRSFGCEWPVYEIISQNRQSFKI